jgi:hypothetical protein
MLGDLPVALNGLCSAASGPARDYRREISGLQAE